MNSSLTPVRSPPRGKLNCRARACCSDKMFTGYQPWEYINTGAETIFHDAAVAQRSAVPMRTLRMNHASPAHEPLGRSVFFCGNPGRSFHQLRCKRFRFVSLAKGLREIAPKSVRQITMLNAALMEQTGA